jgi:hypothetical protein
MGTTGLVVMTPLIFDRRFSNSAEETINFIKTGFVTVGIISP